MIAQGFPFPVSFCHGKKWNRRSPGDYAALQGESTQQPPVSVQKSVICNFEATVCGFYYTQHSVWEHPVCRPYSWWPQYLVLLTVVVLTAGRWLGLSHACPSGGLGQPRTQAWQLCPFFFPKENFKATYLHLLSSFCERLGKLTHLLYCLLPIAVLELTWGALPSH